MAQKVVVVKTMQDDLDGTEWKEEDEGAGRTVSFGWEGKTYAIDLKAENADEFAKMMERYVERARRVGNSHTASPARSRHTGDGRRRGGGQGMGRSKEELAEIREWARANGYEVADSGLIPKKIMEAWESKDSTPTIPSTQATVRPAGKAPGFQEPVAAGRVSPLDALIPPRVSAPVRDSDNR